jgi:heme exporter protein D
VLHAREPIHAFLLSTFAASQHDCDVHMVWLCVQEQKMLQDINRRKNREKQRRVR